jgi:GMP reductase
MNKKLYYDDIALVPKFSTATSRSELDVSTNLGGRSIKLPVIPANMKCVIDTKIAHFLSEHDYFYIMHRFDIDNYEFVEKVKG